MRDKESGQSHSTIKGVKSCSRSDMVFVSSVETFDDLLERAELLRVKVEVFQTDHPDMIDFVFREFVLIEVESSGHIRRISISDDGDFLVRVSLSDGFLDGGDSRDDASVIGQMVS